MQRRKNIFDMIGSLIPGYKGYADRDGRRTCDKIVRDAAAATLAQAERKLNDYMLELLKLKDRETLREVEAARKQLNTLFSRVKYASYGATSFFADNQIKEDELQTIYSYDLDIVQSAKTIGAHAESRLIEQLRLSLRDLDDRINDRTNFINDFR